MRRRSLFLAIILLVLSTGALNTWPAIGPKADALWLHYIGYRWFEPERASMAEQVNRLGDEYGSLEMARREVVFRNYPLAAITQYAVHGMKNLPVAIGLGLLLHYAIGVALFVWALFALRDIVPLGLALAALALTTVLPGPKPTDHLLLYSGFEAVANFIAVIVAPGEIFSPMSPWPKNIVLLLAMAVFSLRWQGRPRMAYILFLPMMLFHVSLGLVVLSLVLAIDVLRRFVRRLQGPDWDAALAVAGCAGGGVLGIVIYVIADPAMPWDVPSAFVQLATRLFVLGSLVIVLWCATKATDWLRMKMDGDAVTVANAFVWGTVLLMSYAAAGGLWERARVIQAGYEKLADPSSPQRHEIEGVYFHILTDLKAAQPR